MAINPVSSSFPIPASAVAPASVPQAPTTPPSLAELQALEGSALDPMLIDPSPSATNQQDTSGSLIDNFNSMIGGSGTGDPLLDDLNSMDNSSSLDPSSSDPALLEDAALNQGLTSFLMDQATSSYTASQLLGGGGSGATGSLGSTTA